MDATSTCRLHEQRVTLSLGRMILAALSFAAALLPAPVQDGVANKSTSEQAAQETRFKALLAEAQAAQSAGDTGRMYAKLDEAAKLSNNPEVQHKVGHLYAADKSVPDGAAKALHWYTEAASLGHGEAISHVVEALANDDLLADAEYSRLVKALDKGSNKGFLTTGSDTLSRLEKKHVASVQCASGLAARLGYVADQQTVVSFLGRGSERPTEWFRVRSGSGAQSRGDSLNIYGADPASYSRYARLSVIASGFTGIKFGRTGVISTKEYVGAADASGQGNQDARTILNACRPKSQASR